MLNDFSFEVLEAYPLRHAAAPTMAFKLRIASSARVHVHSMALKCQVRIEPQRRRYSQAEQAQLFSLFSDGSRWEDTLKPFLWAHVVANIRSFDDATEVQLEVPCSYDMEVAAGKYFHSMRDGGVPLVFLFSGMIFGEGIGGGLSVQPLSWDCEANFTLPAGAWSEMMDHYFPNKGWILVDRDTLDEFERYKAARAAPTWDAALQSLLSYAGEGEATR